MPKGFDACRKAGGRIRTVKPKEGVYIPVCYIGGKSYRGEVHHNRKDGGDGRSPVAAAIKHSMKK